MFEPKSFLDIPSVLVITPPAAKAIDRVGAVHHMETLLVIANLCARHKENIAEQLEKTPLDGSTGGVFISILPDNLAVVDTMLPPGFNRAYLICIHDEAERALMDIEDFINHSGNKILRI